MRSVPIAFAAACFFAGVEGLADEQPSADLRGTFAPLHHEAGLSTEPADSPDTGDITGVVRVSYAFRPVVLRQNGEIVYSVVEHQFTGNLGFSVGLAGRLTLGVDLPILMGQLGDDLSGDPDAVALVGDKPIPLSAVGDPGVRMKVTIVKPDTSSGSVRGFALAVDERLTLPLGDESSFLGEGTVASLTRILAELNPGVVSVHVYAGAKLRSDTGAYACPTDPPGTATCLSRFGHELPVGLGLALHLKDLGIDPDGRGTLFLEGRGYMPLDPVRPDESTLPAGYFASLAGRVRFGDVALLGGLEMALLDGVGNAPFRATVGLSFAPRAKDTDKDALPDDRDKCPTWAEDRDGFEDLDGCPEMDNDLDGVPDDLDACRDQPGPASEKESGCPR